jgi:hypothetical protein
MRDPLTLSSKASLSKKITKKCPKIAKIAKTAKSHLKVPKIGSNGLFERFWNVFLPKKARKGPKCTLFRSFGTKFSLSHAVQK